MLAEVHVFEMNRFNCDDYFTTAVPSLKKLKLLASSCTAQVTIQSTCICMSSQHVAVWNVDELDLRRVAESFSTASTDGFTGHCWAYVWIRAGCTIVVQRWTRSSRSPRTSSRRLCVAPFLANVLRYVRYMLSAVRLLSVVCLSVCLSVCLWRWCTLLRRLNFSAIFFHHTIAQGLYFSGAKNRWWGTPLFPWNLRSKWRTPSENADFQNFRLVSLQQ